MAGYKFVKVRSKCQIKGCRSTGLKVSTFSVAASREGGASIVVCEKCIEGMFEKLCLLREVPTYAELVEMQNAECKVQNDDEKEMLVKIKLLTEENEQLKAENVDLKNKQSAESNAKTSEVTDGEGVNKEPAGKQEAADVQKPKKKSKDSE